MKKEIIIWTIIWVIIWTLITNLLYFTQTKFKDTPQSELVKMFYETEVATNVSAHSLRKKIESWDDSFILVDIRSKEEYDNEHIKSSINIPAYTDKDNIWNTSKDRILESFQKLDTNKEIILYCYSHYCMSSRKIWLFLAENKIFVKHLTVWWNEWRYNWKLWNYPHEDDNTEKIIEKNPFLKNWTWSANWCEIKWEFSC
jgi:rhodanese-related sulfurtransferase